jgi:hypothetical protein
MVEYWNSGRREGRRIAVLAVDPTALPRREPQARRRVPLPDQSIPAFHYSIIPMKLLP